MKNKLFFALQACLQDPKVEKIIVAYSGGMDSHVLLHALVAQFSELSIEAVYVNHQQSVNSDQWQVHTQAVCEQLNIPYHACQVDPEFKPGASVEAALREARYAALETFVTDNKTALMVAHHADDQVETVLLRLLRGAGPSGLAAMQASQPFSQGLLLRPFLSLTRDELLQYAQQYQLAWIEDESNRNERFDRNYLRQAVIPLLKNRWPGLCKSIPRTAQLCQETDALLQEVALGDGVTADNPLRWQLQDLSPIRQRNAIRHWLSLLGVLPPTQAQLANFLQQMQCAAADKVPTLYLAKGVVRYYKKQLYYAAVVPSSLVVPESAGSTYPGSSLSQRVVVHDAIGEGLSKNKVRLPLTIQTRSGGETIKIGNSHCHQRLKNCWQKWGVPPWLRDDYPLVFQDGKLIAVPGYAYDADYAAGPGEAGLVLQLAIGISI